MMLAVFQHGAMDDRRDLTNDAELWFALPVG